MTDAAEFVPRRSARVASQKRDADEPVVKPPTKAKNGTVSSAPPVKKAKTEATVTKEKITTLSVGDALPEVTLKDQDGNDVNISEIAKTSTVVIFAYPKASTPGCTKQACGFRDHHPEFASKSVKVFGLSADSVNAQKNFQTKQKLPYQLLSDVKYELIEPLGAKKTAKGGVTRSHWIIKDGKLVVVAVGISPADSYTNALASVSEGDSKEEPKEESTEEAKAEEAKEVAKEDAKKEVKENGEETKEAEVKEAEAKEEVKSDEPAEEAKEPAQPEAATA